MHQLEVTEQKPLENSGSIFCECSLVARRDDGSIYSTIVLHHPYFVCNKDKVITQYSEWLLEYKKQVIKLGYKF